MTGGGDGFADLSVRALAAQYQSDAEKPPVRSLEVFRVVKM